MRQKGSKYQRSAQWASQLTSLWGIWQELHRSIKKSEESGCRTQITSARVSPQKEKGPSKWELLKAGRKLGNWAMRRQRGLGTTWSQEWSLNNTLDGTWHLLGFLGRLSKREKIWKTADRIKEKEGVEDKTLQKQHRVQEEEMWKQKKMPEIKIMPFSR